MTVIVCYGPTEDSVDVEQDSFYDQLQTLVDKIPAHDVLLIMGDLNAKVGSNNKGKENTMREHSLGDINNSGDRLTSFCQETRLVIGGTIFEHKNTHKLTWTSPDGITKKQIDHIIINNRWRSSFRDVVVRRGADVGGDHSSVMAKIMLKLIKTKKRDQRDPPLNIAKLNDPAERKTF